MEERNMNRYDFDSSYAHAGLTLNQYVSRTFGWMFCWVDDHIFAGGGSGYDRIGRLLFYKPLYPDGSADCGGYGGARHVHGILKRSVGVTRMLFTIYSILNGMVFSVYL